MPPSVKIIRKHPICSASSLKRIHFLFWWDASAPLVFAFGQPRFSLSGKGRHPELIKAIEPTLGDRSIYREARAFFNLKILSSPIQISAAWGYSLNVVNLDSGVFLDSAQERI
ncbi:hypothetical protein H6G52_12845 [Limnothrix sp. FACHB-881]|uniref:hypothetical protein n=1 Tax=Limnothrix sp. FACHB-881 TaxID=2692819 RepID=UPI0016847221|nr:hypothetical protein [Limnothrix sp. FACHB-881]MBD2636252.1 hypothetical protein [Limnothrix sp. FACHB-881]